MQSKLRILQIILISISRDPDWIAILGRHIPIDIQMANRIHVIGFKFTIRATLAAMDRAGRVGTQGTLNRKPSVDWL